MTTTLPRRRRWSFGIATLAGIAMLGAACSADAESMTDEELRTELIEVLTEDGTVTDSQATCVVDGLFEQGDRDQINRMANAQEADEITDGDMELLTDVMLGCL